MKTKNLFIAVSVLVSIAVLVVTLDSYGIGRNTSLESKIKRTLNLRSALSQDDRVLLLEGYLEQKVEYQKQMDSACQGELVAGGLPSNTCKEMAKTLATLERYDDKIRRMLAKLS